MLHAGVHNLPAPSNDAVMLLLRLRLRHMVWLVSPATCLTAASSSQPPPTARLMPVVSLAVLGGVGSVGYKLYYAPFMRHQALYAAGALVVYWFSVSGGCQAREGWWGLGRCGCLGLGLGRAVMSLLRHTPLVSRLPPQPPALLPPTHPPALLSAPSCPSSQAACSTSSAACRWWATTHASAKPCCSWQARVRGKGAGVHWRCVCGALQSHVALQVSRLLHIQSNYPAGAP